MNKKLQVFVSSTYTDLIEERQAAVEAILQAGHIPAGMELFSAGNDSQLQTIYKWIDESDVYMLILGGRYGSIDTKTGKSYTQLEYEYALSKNIPIFSIVLSDSYLTNNIAKNGLNNTMEQDTPDKYKDFKSLVMSKIVKLVNDTKDIKLGIIISLYSLLDTYPFIGWVKSNPTNSTTTINNSAYKPSTNQNIIHEENNNGNLSVFVIMPFTEKWSDDTYLVLKDICQDINVNITRADEILGSNVIINDIITQIKTSDIIIADVTVRNANVYYELGFANALGKKVILIAQDGAEIPFDISHLRFILYDLSYKKIREFKKVLLKTILSYK